MRRDVKSIPKYSEIFRIPVQEVQATESLRNLCDLCDFASSAMAWTCATWTQSAECAVEICRTVKIWWKIRQWEHMGTLNTARILLELAQQAFTEDLVTFYSAPILKAVQSKHDICEPTLSHACVMHLYGASTLASLANSALRSLIGKPNTWAVIDVMTIWFFTEQNTKHLHF